VGKKTLRQVGMVIGAPLLPVRRGLQVLADIQRRERQRLAAEMSQTRGLMPLLMKQRNGYHWTDEDRRIIRSDVAALMHMSPYLILFVAPGGFFVMPVLAWWLDRRRIQRQSAGASPSVE
jgi:hypothetical protein